jgi:hypothetical protein
MRIKVERFEFGKDYTLSKVYLDGRFECYAIEDEIREVKVKGETAVPYGKYELGMRYSPKFTPRTGHDMLWVKNVPNFQWILIHTGNTEKDTDGCLIVGTRPGYLNGGARAVLGSKMAYDKLYPQVLAAMDAGQKVTIEYVKAEK